MTEEAKRILLVDDDPVFTSVMARGFKRRGFITHGCANAEQALLVLRTGKIDSDVHSGCFPGPRQLQTPGPV